MFDKFKAKAEAVGAEVHRVTGKKDAQEFIISFLRKEGVDDKPESYALWSDTGFLN